LSGRGKRTTAAGFSPPPTLAPTNADTLARLAARKSAFPSAEKTSARRLSADLGMDKSPPHKHGLDEKANHHMQHNCNNKLQFVVFF
jgi:hypothetical protein